MPNWRDWETLRLTSFSVVFADRNKSDVDAANIGNFRHAIPCCVSVCRAI
jgi:hypothetical protein